MGDSWGSSPSISASDSEETGLSDVVNDNHGMPLCNFLVKGGNTNDKGAKFSIPFDSRFTMVYVEYARRAGVRPTELRLFHRNEYVSPDDSPFRIGFRDHDVVLAYGEDCSTPIPYNPQAVPDGADNKCFTIQDLKTVPAVTRYNINKATLIRDLRAHWGRRHGVTASHVFLYLDGKNITWRTSVDTARVYDGAVMYGVIGNPGLPW